MAPTVGWVTRSQGIESAFENTIGPSSNKGLCWQAGGYVKHPWSWPSSSLTVAVFWALGPGERGNMKYQASVSTKNSMVCRLTKLPRAPQVGLLSDSGEGSSRALSSVQMGELLSSSCCSGGHLTLEYLPWELAKVSGKGEVSPSRFCPWVFPPAATEETCPRKATWGWPFLG